MSNSRLTAQLRGAMPFAEVLGLELVDASPGEVRGRAAWGPGLCTAGGVLHGGALMGLADCCGGFCAHVNLPDAGSATTTIESKTNFLRAVREGEVTITSRPLHVGRRLIVVETEIEDQTRRLVAKVSQTQAVIAAS